MGVGGSTETLLGAAVLRAGTKPRPTEVAGKGRWWRPSPTVGSNSERDRISEWSPGGEGAGEMGRGGK